MKPSNPVTRREVLKQAAGLAALGAMPAPSLWAGPAPKYPMGKADHCIMLWLGGGAAQIDTFDPKRLGDPAKRVAGAAYPAIDTAVAGVQVCEHLPRCASLMDRFVLMRTVHHDVVDEHAAAVNRMHTGRPTSGTIVYPSIGSIVAHEREAADETVPAYVVMGYPNVTRGPGFLGAKYSYLYLTDTEAGPAGLKRPEDVSPQRQARREALLDALRNPFVAGAPQDRAVVDYNDTIDRSIRLASPTFMNVFNLAEEAASLRESYGGEFGQRCLLARRLIERGVRFVEVAHNLNFINGTGWDTHNEGQRNQHILIRELDSALATLVTDLERRKLLDRTLIVVSTEFGRPAQFDERGGRGHHPKAFTVALAGGSLRTGQTVGQTDDLAMNVAERPVSVPDLFATIFCALGIDPSKELHDGDRPVPITDRGEPVRSVIV